MIVPYSPKPEEGTAPVALPDRCLLSKASEGLCRISVDHWRARVTGPCFPICVVRCATHHTSFTLYPPGHVPYGRVAVAPVATDGEVIASAGSAQRESAWGGTLLDAALDGGRGVAWPRDPALDDPRWWQTQRRRISRAATLLGLDPAVDDAERDLLARELEVPALVLRDRACEWRMASGYRSRGAVVSAVAGELCVARCVLDRVLVAGALAGLWGRPYRWDPTARVLRDLLRMRGRPP